MDTKNLKDKRVLITGGSGYLGHKVIETLLSLKALVYSIDIKDDFQYPGVSYHHVNLLDINAVSDAVRKIQPVFIYHLAASLDRTRDFSFVNVIFDTNLIGTVNLLNALKECEYKNFIFVSTSEVYGGKSLKPPFKEDDNIIPASPYSLSKYCAEMSIKTYSKIYSKNYTILRLFNFFGKDMPKSFFLPQLIDKLKKGEDFNMTGGEQIRDFLYVDDVLQAMVLSTSVNAYNEVFNVCSGYGKTIKEVAFEIKKKLNSKSKINIGALPYQENEVWEMTGDNSKIKKILKWQPKLHIMEGILKTI